MLGLLRRLPGPFATRGEAVAALEAEGVATGVAQWVSTNLEPVAPDGGGGVSVGGAPPGALRWRLELDAMEALLVDFFRVDLWDVVEHPPDDVHIHFLKAAASAVLPEPVAERIEAIGELDVFPRGGREGRVEGMRREQRTHLPAKPIPAAQAVQRIVFRRHFDADRGQRIRHAERHQSRRQIERHRCGQPVPPAAAEDPGRQQHDERDIGRRRPVWLRPRQEADGQHHRQGR